MFRSIRNYDIYIIYIIYICNILNLLEKLKKHNALFEVSQVWNVLFTYSKVITENKLISITNQTEIHE